ncbi:BatA domain-containing protein [Christiangramia fulva]|nr:BatA domain-containing protein [Christiangramia fulva]
MHFLHPELLYAFFLLLIPLIVHLFRLRRFQKEDFTNVKFLKKVIQETRKSSRLKKFLVLFSRMLLLACIIIAFAQPYIPHGPASSREPKRLVFLDNSFSMQAPLNDVTLLKNSLNRLYESLGENLQFDLFTNDREYFNLSASQLKKELQNVNFTQERYDFRQLRLKAENYFRKYPNSKKEFILISDFQQNLEIPTELPKDSISYTFLAQTPGDFFNSSIDTAYIASSDPESINLKFGLSASGNSEEDFAVSVYDGDRLLGRNTVNFSEEQNTEIQFRLQNEKINNGIIKIEDSGLLYDNRLFFNIGEKQPVKVVVISDAPASFLEKIYTKPEFEISVFSPTRIDFNQLNSANLVILSEVENISASLLNNLKNIHKSGTSLIIIPPEKAENYASLLNNLGFPDFGEIVPADKLITEIEFDHPLLSDVFEDRVENFEYPKVSKSFPFNSGNPVLRFADGSPFLSANNNVFIFTAPLNRENSNFLNSPLVVPVFYSIGLQSFKTNDLYYLSNTQNNIDIPVKIENDHVLHLVKNDLDLIPQQQNFSNKLEILIPSENLPAGNYKLINNENETGTLSFNYGREESKLKYASLQNLKNARVKKDINDYFSAAIASSHITLLWKWFVIFALIFLAIEMLLLKFLK